MPLIAMTREMGSLGKDVAAAVSARLGKPVVHHEILVKDPEFEETEQSRQMLSDLALETHARAALRADPRTKNMQINITACCGEITLSGILELGLEEKHAAEVVAGVSRVKNVKSALKMATLSRVKLDV